MPPHLVTLDAAQVLALAALGVVAGQQLRRYMPIFARLHIPAPVLGGLLLAITATTLRDRVLNLQPDTTLQPILMVAFFTTIGLNASIGLLRLGGGMVARLTALAGLGAILQNAVGIGLCRLMGLDPLLGVIAGAVTLAGGPATAVAFGSTFERLGVPAATTIAVAAAMFGITVSGLVSGYVGAWLVRRHQLAGALTAIVPAAPATSELTTAAAGILQQVVLVALAMGLGSVVQIGFAAVGITLPAFIGPMLVAASFRAFDDRTGLLSIEPRTVEALGTAALALFLTMALLTLRLWELTQLALPLLAILSAQVVLTVLLTVVVVYPALGRDYEAAVAAGGWCGFLLGTTANAMACLSVLTDRYGPAPRAWLAVPVVGGFLIDLVNSVVITATAGLIRR